jgi:hypothetical protein
MPNLPLLAERFPHLSSNLIAAPVNRRPEGHPQTLQIDTPFRRECLDRPDTNSLERASPARVHRTHNTVLRRDQQHRNTICRGNPQQDPWFRRDHSVSFWPVVLVITMGDYHNIIAMHLLDGSQCEPFPIEPRECFTVVQPPRESVHQSGNLIPAHCMEPERRRGRFHASPVISEVTLVTVLFRSLA